MSVAIKMSNISKNYGSKKVLKNINLSIDSGEIYGLIGRNGAGKTTIMKILLGLVVQTEGKVEFSEHNNQEARLTIGSIIESPTFFDNKTVYQNMAYIAKLYGVENYNEKIDSLLELVEMHNEKKSKIKTLSLGMRQKIAIATTLINDPDILILDEPINGLDPVAIAEIRAILKKTNKENGTTIFISSHILGEMQKLATKYGFIDKGALVKEITEQEVEEQGIDLENLALELMGVEING